MRLLRLVAGDLERAARRLGLLARLLELADVTQRLGAPVRVLGGGDARDAAVEHREVLERRGGVAAARPGALDEAEHEAGRDVVVARAQQVAHAVLHDAPRADLGVLRERVRREPEDRGRVVALVEAPEQVLLEERVRPAELIVARREEDLRARQRDERVARVHAERREQRLQHDAADVVAERRRRVRREAQIGRAPRGGARPRDRRS